MSEFDEPLHAPAMVNTPPEIANRGVFIHETVVFEAPGPVVRVASPRFLFAMKVGVPGVTVPKWRIIVLLTRVGGLGVGGVGVLGLR